MKVLVFDMVDFEGVVALTLFLKRGIFFDETIELSCSMNEES